MSLHLLTASGQPGTEPTMSSREIAELLNSRHDSVKRTFERLAEKGLIRFTPSVETSHDGAGARDVEVYRVNKRGSYIVVAQLSPEFTARLVDRWQELEAAAAQAAFPIPKSMSEALQLAADQARQLELQDKAIAELKPKATAYDSFINADGLFGYQNAGRALGCYPQKFTNWLKLRYCFYQGGSLIPRSEFVNSGLFVVKGEVGTDEVTRPRGYITPKGVAYFANRIPSDILVAPRSASDPLPLFTKTKH